MHFFKLLNSYTLKLILLQINYMHTLILCIIIKNIILFCLINFFRNKISSDID